MAGMGMSPEQIHAAAQKKKVGEGNIGDADYGFDDLFANIGEGADRAGRLITGAPSPEQEAASAALQGQFAQMADAYRAYRGLAADARQNELSAFLTARAPYQQVLNLRMPDIQPMNNGLLQDHLRWNADMIKENSIPGGVTGDQGPAAAVSQPWPVTVPGTSTAQRKLALWQQLPRGRYV
jgi:hypothetical protein